ncbi:MAG: hypothetical protein ABI164_03845 [Acidobacteriaceae bacterium]
MELKNTPTRFGRIDLLAELAGRSGWPMKRHRDGKNAPVRIEAPVRLGSTKVTRVEGAEYKFKNGHITIHPAATDFTVFWG